MDLNQRAEGDALDWSRNELPGSASLIDSMRKATRLDVVEEGLKQNLEEEKTATKGNV